MRQHYTLVHMLKIPITMTENNQFDIYFDNASTTKPIKEVVDIFTNELLNDYYNPSSTHHLGLKMSRNIDICKQNIMNILSINNYDIIFTSGASESNNLALKGFARKYRNRGNHIITSKIEHPSVINTCEALRDEGFTLSYLDVDNRGHFNLDQLEQLINDETILVSLMAVNNEIGVIQNIESIISIIRKHPKIKLHVDMVQGFMKFNFPYQDIDMFTISLHKIGGLSNTGVLFKKKSIALEPLINGGGQQNNYRSGTLSYPLINSVYNTIKYNFDYHKKHFIQINDIANIIINYLRNNEALYHINSDEHNPYIINFSLTNKKASVVVEALSNRGIYVATRSACSSRSNSPSYVLEAIGLNDQEASNAIRISFSYFNTREEAQIFIQILDEIIKEIR